MDLKRLYQELGGKSKNPRPAAMVQFVRLKLIDTLLNGLPDYLLYDIPKAFNIKLDRPGRIKSTIKDKAKSDPQFLADLVALGANVPTSNFNRTKRAAAERSYQKLKYMNHLNNSLWILGKHQQMNTF